jgi:hypothetical protein
MSEYLDATNTEQVADSSPNPQLSQGPPDR